MEDIFSNFFQDKNICSKTKFLEAKSFYNPKISLKFWPIFDAMILRIKDAFLQITDQ